jgi:hypothetical protein
LIIETAVLENSTDGILFLHEQYHDTKAIKKIKYMIGDASIDSELTLNFKKISDPFEFQEWCIENGYEEYL